MEFLSTGKEFSWLDFGDFENKWRKQMGFEIYKPSDECFWFW
jgi:hypothetical protein